VRGLYGLGMRGEMGNVRGGVGKLFMGELVGVSWWKA